MEKYCKKNGEINYLIASVRKLNTGYVYRKKPGVSTRSLYTCISDPTNKYSYSLVGGCEYLAHIFVKKKSDKLPCILPQP
jgi:hypothetical protein